MKLKKILFIVCTVLLCTATINAQGIIDSGNCGANGDNLAWQLTEDGTLTISGIGAMENYIGFYCADCVEPNIYPPWFHQPIKTVIIQGGVTTIGDFAFWNCKDLTLITISNTVTEIGNFAFSYCVGLTTLTIPKLVSTINMSAFDNCNGLAEINVDVDNFDYSSEDGILYDKSKNTLFHCPRGKQGTVIIPDVVTTIANNAFGLCAGITEVIIGNSVASIEDYAFSGCGLTEITLPKSVTTIGGLAFYSFSIELIIVDTDNPNYSSNDGMLLNKLQDILIYCPIGKQGAVIIPNTVTLIKMRAFSECNLTSITIPNSVNTIEDWAFNRNNGNGNLTDIYVSWETPPNIDSYSWDGIVYSYVFSGIAQFIVKLHIPQGTLFTYQNANVWKNFQLVETTGINENKIGTVEIYPNPVLESFYISGLVENTFVTISDINGKIVLQQMVSPNGNVLAGHLSSGVYYVNVKGKVVKMIKK